MKILSDCLTVYFAVCFTIVSIGTQAIASPKSVKANPKFVKVSSEINHIYNGGWEHFVGGGLATFDCNNDGFLDFFAAGGKNPAALFLNITNKKNGNIKFKQATPKSMKQTHVVGAYPIDIDGDGILDIVVLRVGENTLLKGKGNCQFENFETLNFKSFDKWTTSFSAKWEKGNKLPTLAFGNYVDRKNPNGPFEACDINYLYQPRYGQYQKPIELKPGYCALSMLFSDWGRSGKADLRISNDRHYYVKNGHEQLWKIGQTPSLYTKAEGWQPFKLWGMGIASRDITGDGLPDIFLSSMGDQKLQILETKDGKPNYKNVKFDRGTSAQRPYFGDDGRPSTGWQIEFGDVQNDGRDDVFISKGNVDQMPSNAMKDPNNLLVQNMDGTFNEFGKQAGIADEARSRGASLHDFNNDGLLDLIVINRRDKMQIYQNKTKNTGNWIGVQLFQKSDNKNAIGAWIDLKANDKIFSREITIGGGHASGAIAPEHFGLGKVKKIQLQVTWPDGEKSSWKDFDANQYITVQALSNPHQS